MSILLTALSVLGWALAVLLCLLLLALFTPARLVLELRYDAFCARLKVLCFTFTLYPRRQKPQGGAPGEMCIRDRDNPRLCCGE